MNICGALVFAVPDRVEEIACNLARYAGVEVHNASSDGRIIVTAEDTCRSTAFDALRDIAALKGVIATSLVYHHFEQDQPRAGSSLESSQ